MDTNNSKIIYEDLGFKLNGIFYKVQNELGLYCNEQQYGDGVEKYLKLSGIDYQRELILPPSFEGEQPARNKADFVVDGKIILELKAKKFLTTEDYYQIRRYLSALNLKLGIVVNFRDKRVNPKRIINSAA